MTAMSSERVQDAEPSPLPASHAAASDDIVKKEKQLANARAYVVQTEVERGRLKVFLILAATTWPIGLVWHWLWCVAIALSWLTFFAVGSYLSFFHRRNARSRVEDLERQLRAQGVDPDDAIEA